MWSGGNNQNDPDNLEALGSGFNVTLEALPDVEIREKIASKIRELAQVTDEIVRFIDNALKKSNNHMLKGVIKCNLDLLQ